MIELLKLVWRMRMFDCESLYLTDGRKIELLSPGTPNVHSEILPEFYGAGFRIMEEDLELHGSVKVDINSVDWYFQKTVASAQFDNVILHVVINADAAVMHNNRIVPTLVINIPEELIDYRRGLAMDCKDKFSEVDTVYSENFISRLATDRIERKSKEVIKIFQEAKKNWAQTALIVIIRSFGYGETKESLEKLAKGLSLYMLYTNCTDLQTLEALLFGYAGYLEGERSKDLYVFDLQERYKKLCKQFQIPKASFNWHTSKVRPQSLPHYHLARIAAIFYNNATLLDHILKERELDELKQLLMADLSEYWTNHSALGVQGRGVSKMTGEKIDLVIINGVIPLLYAYGALNDDMPLQEWALDMLGGVYESNSKVNQWADAGYIVKNGYYSQALIQMNDVYCRSNGCDRCPFGSYLLHKRYKLYCEVKNQLAKQ